MEKLLSFPWIITRKFIFLITFTLLLVSGCDFQSGIDNLQQQIEELKTGEIATIQAQMASIQASVGDLQQVDTELKGLIKTLQDELGSLDGELDEKYEALQKKIDVLCAADEALETRITELKTYCTLQDNNLRDWVATTYTTLEQHGAVLVEIANIKIRIGEITAAITNLDSTLSQKISDSESRVMTAIGDSETSIKGWVSEQLSGYYTISEIEAKVIALQNEINSGDSSISKELESQVSEIYKAIEAQKKELTEGYKQEISDAIKTNNGVIDGKISEAITSLNEQISTNLTALSNRIDAIEARIANLEEAVAKLVSRIQSMTYIPRFSDGASTMWWKEEETGIRARDTLDFRISPSSCLEELLAVWDIALKAEGIEVLTRAGVGESVSLPILSAWGEKGILSIEVSGDNLDSRFFSSELPMYCAVIVSDGNNEFSSDYIRMIPDSEPRLAVAPATLSVNADATSAKFNIQSTIKWTVSSDNENFVPSTTEGVNNAEITVSFPTNMSFNNDIQAVITVSPKYSESDLSPVTVTITQAKAKGDAPEGSWVRVASVSDITSGGTFIIGYEATQDSGVIIPMRNDAGTAKTSADGYIYSGTDSSASGDGTIDMADVDDVSAYIVEISASTAVTGAVNIKLGDNYLGLRNSTSSSSNKNFCRLYTEASDKTAFKVTAGEKGAFNLKIEHADQPKYHTLQYNTSKDTHRFSFYENTQGDPVLYKLSE